MTSLRDCPFCERIRLGQVALSIGGAVAFEPLNPVTKGHMLFVPIVHVPDARDAIGLADAMALAGGWAADHDADFNLITSAGTLASQTVMHLHVHYVPRRKGDNLKLPWSAP